jgi:predicted permease
MQTLWQDLKYGLRMLVKAPGFTMIAILTLALGIGANTAIFSLIDAVMLRSLPVHDPQHLYLLRWSAHKTPQYHGFMSSGDCPMNDRGANPSGCSLSNPLFKGLQSQTNVFSSLAAFAYAGRLDMSGNGPASVLLGQLVSGEYFKTLGVRAAAGRTIESADDMPSAEPVVVLNYGYWQSAFGGSPSAVGRSIRLNGVPCTIVGVAEARFTSLTPGSVYDAWVPFSAAPRLNARMGPQQADAAFWWLTVVGRLKPGIPQSQAQSAVSVFFRNEMLHGEKPMSQAADDPAIQLPSAQEGLSGARARYATPLYVLMLAVGIVLLIACANIAGLMLARSTVRRKEMAVRLALGAGRARIVRQLLTESMMLAALGGVLGIFLASWSAHALLSFVSSSRSQPLGLSAGIDWRILGFTAAISVFTGILFGLAPALRSTRVDLTPALREDSGSSSHVSHSRIRWLSVGNALVVAQVALTIVVLAGAGLLVRTLQNLKSIDPGFDTRNVLVFSIDPTLSGYKGAQLNNVYRNLQSRFAALPGVNSASYSMMPLLSGSLMITGFPRPGAPDKGEVDADFLPVGPGFFETMKIPTLAGREFSSADFAAAETSDSSATPSSAPTPAVVNETFVRRYLENANPIGLRFGASEEGAEKNPGWEIIGVVRDAKYNNLRREINPTVYVPITGGGAYFELRTASNPAAIVPAVRSVVGQLDSNLPLFDVKTETEQIDELLFQERLIARLSSFFGLLALLLASVGLYGLLSYEVTRRTREIGVRMALGAQQRDVLPLVVVQGIALALAGAVGGIGLAYGVTRYLASLLYDVRPGDPATLAAVSILLLLVALAACYLPARRATRVDPMVALRYE